MSDKCKHEWEYYDLLCFPPIKKKRCKLCGYEHEWDLPQTEKVEDSGSEADFGTKDKEDSWEDEIGDVLYECCRSPYHDIAFEKIAPIIKSLLETEKKKAEARGFNTLLATSGCYSFEQTKQLIEAERNKHVTFKDLTIETRMIDGKQWYHVEGGLNEMLELEKKKAVYNAVDILIIFPKVLNESKECIDALLAKYKK